LLAHDPQRVLVRRRPLEETEEAVLAQARGTRSMEDDGAPVGDAALGVLDALLRLVEVAPERSLDGRDEEVERPANLAPERDARLGEDLLERGAKAADAPRDHALVGPHLVDTEQALAERGRDLRDALEDRVPLEDERRRAGLERALVVRLDPLEAHDADRRG